ncbi:hypothetical protein C5D35_04105 [Rathayibacter toxicus]|nr:hypothetical protein C5D35_04105 [Rathayibacter toxicus]
MASSVRLRSVVLMRAEGGRKDHAFGLLNRGESDCVGRCRVQRIDVIDSLHATRFAASTVQLCV